MKEKQKRKKNKNPHEWIKSITALITAACAFATIFVAKTIVKNINQQTQVVIEPRDGDIIVKDGDDYKLLQLINREDILFPTKIQEVKNKSNESNQEIRVDINNINNEDWTERDSFKYVINEFSINPNKVINLLENISNITVYCDFYSEKNIATKINLGEQSFKFFMKESLNQKDFEITISNKESKYEYVTKEINDGIEWVKIRVEIKYIINNSIITDTISSDWIETDADII